MLAGFAGVFSGDASARFYAVFGVKVALVALLVAGAYVHDFVLGPGLARANPRGPSADPAQAARRRRLAQLLPDADRPRPRGPCWRISVRLALCSTRSTAPPTSESLDRFAKLIGGALEGVGFTSTNGDAGEANLVISLLDLDDPKPFRRRGKGTYVVGVFERERHPEPIEESLRADYPQLLRGLANLVLDYVPGQGVWFTTMERGHYGITADDERRSSRRRWSSGCVPLASSRLVIDNEFRTDLEEELWDGRRGHRLDSRGRRPARRARPAPEPVPDRGPAHRARAAPRQAAVRDRRPLLRQSLGAQGRAPVLDERERRRQVAASRSRAATSCSSPDYDSANGRMVLSVPPDVEPRRVSVDAIEHWMIYQEHPDVGAIVHVHAWMEGISATDVNYPCGTEELARSVAELVRQAPDPDHAVVGLRNHGITVTGPSLEEILDRIEPTRPARDPDDLAAA